MNEPTQAIKWSDDPTGLYISNEDCKKFIDDLKAGDSSDILKLLTTFENSIRLRISAVGGDYEDENGNSLEYGES